MTPTEIRQLAVQMRLVDEPTVAGLLASLADLLEVAYEEPTDETKGVNILMRIEDMKP